MDVQTAKDSVAKKYGAGTLMTITDKGVPDVLCPTAFVGLEEAMGVPGIPKNRIVEVYGPECISGDSFIPYEVWSNDDKIRRNHKGGTIRRLYERFHDCKTNIGTKQGRHLQNNDSKFYVKSVNHNDCVVRNEVLDVVKTGIKRCFKLTTEDGQIIYATGEHKFRTANGFVPLSELRSDDVVFVHNNTRFKGRKHYDCRPEVYVKYHPMLPTKIVDKYLYYRGRVSRMTYEAFMNGMSYDEYIEALNTLPKSEIDKFRFIPDDIHVHHEDEDFTNNDISNLVLVDPSEHGRIHANDRLKNLSFVVAPTKIESLVEYGDMETYDLKCAYPYNNYIADGIVVHNSGGKTTLSLHFIKSVQAVGGKAAFIDVEHALDLDYARNLGVNVDDILLSQPDYGEQAIDIVLMLLRVQKADPYEPFIIVIDSVDAIIPKKELEGEFDPDADKKDQRGGGLGLRARLMSAACRNISSALKDSNAVVIFINQVRSKIGVSFGCFHYDTLVHFVDGRSIQIGRVVDEKIKGKIWSLNEDGVYLQKEITGWHDNGSVDCPEDFIHIQTESVDGGGRFGFTCTRNHEVLTVDGYKKAEEINYRDVLVSKYEKLFTGHYEDLLNAVAIGDSCLSTRSRNTASLRLQDNENPDYVQWKVDILSNVVPFHEVSISRGYRYDTDYLYEFSHLKDKIQNRCPLHFLKHHFTPIGFAIWVMDDGHFSDENGTRNGRYKISMKRFKDDLHIQSKILELLKTKNLEGAFDGDGTLTFTVSSSNLIAEMISRYVPDCMQYKLPREFQGRYDYLPERPSFPDYVKAGVRVIEIRNASSRQMRNPRRFDITVDGTHNYMVGGCRNGVVVHNSPETTSGGRALKFYASMRLDIRNIGQYKEGDKPVGHQFRIKVAKNKLAPPFREYEGLNIYGKGFQQSWDIWETLRMKGHIQTSGSWSTLKGTDIKFQGYRHFRERYDTEEDVASKVMDLIE